MENAAVAKIGPIKAAVGTFSFLATTEPIPATGIMSSQVSPILSPTGASNP